MPIYEYACRACEHQFESIQKASEAPLRDCPACGQATLRKLLSAPVFRLKGSGWYETDFKTGDKRNLVDRQTSEQAEQGGQAEREAPAGKAEQAKGDAGEANGKGPQAKRGAANGGDAKPADAKPAKDAPSGTGGASRAGREGATGAGTKSKPAP